jgi:hypothetical protein
LLAADFTALALEATQTLASLSTALGVAAARVVGLTLADLPGLRRNSPSISLPPNEQRTPTLPRKSTPWRVTGRPYRNGRAAPRCRLRHSPRSPSTRPAWPCRVSMPWAIAPSGKRGVGGSFALCCTRNCVRAAGSVSCVARRRRFR